MSLQVPTPSRAEHGRCREAGNQSFFAKDFSLSTYTHAHTHILGCFSRFTESNNYETVHSQTLRIYLFLRSFLFSRYRVADSRKDRCSRIAEKPPILEESVIDVVQFFPVAPFRSSMGKMLLAVIKRH